MLIALLFGAPSGVQANEQKLVFTTASVVRSVRVSDTRLLFGYGQPNFPSDFYFLRLATFGGST